MSAPLAGDVPTGPRALAAAAPIVALAAHGGHPSGPSSTWESIIVLGAGVIVVVTLVLAAKLLIRPGEASEDHIKRTILDDAARPSRERR